MNPVDQTTFGCPGGNCFSACVASLLELPLAEVPYFMGAGDWLAALRDWLRPRGFYVILCTIDDGWRPEGLFIAGGQSERGPHAVVARGSEMVHDPHPSRAGLLAWEDATIIAPIDPLRRPSCAG